MKPLNHTIAFSISSKYILLINVLSGAIDLVPKKLLNTELPAPIKKTLIKRGYFLSTRQSKEQLALLAKISQQHNKNIPYWFYVLTTLNCNLRCPICYERRVLTNQEISEKEIKKITKVIKNFQNKNQIKSKRIFLVIFGGEPLCLSNQNTLTKIFRIVKKNNWKAIIVTNGTRIKYFLNLFLKYRDVIADFRITLDGTKNIHNTRRPYRSGGGTFDEVVKSIDLLLAHGFKVKIQTILGAGNMQNLNYLAKFIIKKKWLKNPNCQWRIEGSHDYANLDPQKDEISEGKMVKKLIALTEKYPIIKEKIKFESFKYLGHLVHSFGWLGRHKTYWGPKFSFCDPQKGFHFVFATDGKTYHCPRTINQSNYRINYSLKNRRLKNKSVLKMMSCHTCQINTLCGGGCVVQKNNYPKFNCQVYALKTVTEFVNLMKKKIVRCAKPNRIISINQPWDI